MSGNRHLLLFGYNDGNVIEQQRKNKCVCRPVSSSRNNSEFCENVHPPPERDRPQFCCHALQTVEFYTAHDSACKLNKDSGIKNVTASFKIKCVQYARVHGTPALQHCIIRYMSPPPHPRLSPNQNKSYTPNRHNTYISRTPPPSSVSIPPAPIDNNRSPRPPPSSLLI